MLLDHRFSMVVRYFWGLPNQGCVYEVIPCQLFVECLKAEQESTVTKSARTEKYTKNINIGKKNPEILLYHQILDWIFSQFQLQFTWACELLPSTVSPCCKQGLADVGMGQLVSQKRLRWSSIYLLKAAMMFPTSLAHQIAWGHLFLLWAMN